jgi:hypothetical protein
MLSALLDLLLNISRSETSEVARGEVGTSVGKDSGTCIVWEKDFAGAKSLLVKRVSLNRKMPVVENTECRTLGVIDHGRISMYSWMIL